MNLPILTQVSGFLKPFAWIMGEILNAIYWISSHIGIANIAFCIVVFTIVVKMLMLPLTIKQQKFSKVSAKMNPELQKIQEKYKNVDRSDQKAMMQLQQEQQALYQKYGTSPFGGCLPMLIMLPILFALYRVIYAVPAYVTDVKEIYNEVATAIICEYDDLSQGDKDILKEHGVDGNETFQKFYTTSIREFYTANQVSVRDKKDGAIYDNIDLIDIFTVYKTSDWNEMQTCTLDVESKDKNGNLVCEHWNILASTEHFKNAMSSQKENIDKIIKINGLFVFNILDAPSSVWKKYWFVFIFPILAAGLQMLQTKLTMDLQKSDKDDKKKDDNPMASSMKTMNTVMPLMSGVFCFILPIGVGLYWIASSAVSIVQQIAINKHLDKMDIDDIVQENESKQTEKYQKMGIMSTGNTTSTIAKSTTKSITSIHTSDIGEKGKNKKAANNEPAVSQEAKDELAKSDNPSSISSIANIMKNRNKD